jgi:hypothetical protein
MIKAYCLVVILYSQSSVTSQQLCYYPTKDECTDVAATLYDPKRMSVQCVPVYKDEITK